MHVFINLTLATMAPLEAVAIFKKEDASSFCQVARDLVAQTTNRWR